MPKLSFRNKTGTLPSGGAKCERLMSPVGGADGRRKMDTKLEQPLGYFLPLYSLASELPCKIMWQIKT